MGNQAGFSDLLALLLFLIVTYIYKSSVITTTVSEIVILDCTCVQNNNIWNWFQSSCKANWCHHSQLVVCKTNIWFSHSWINFSNDAQFVAVLILLLSLAWFSLPLCKNSVSHLNSPQLNLFFLQNQVSLLVHLHTEDQRPGLGRHDPFSHFAELPTQPPPIDVSSLVVNPAPFLPQTCHHLLREADQDLVSRVWHFGFETFPFFLMVSVSVSEIFGIEKSRTRNQINDTFLFQNRVKVKVVGEVSEKWN